MLSTLLSRSKKGMRSSSSVSDMSSNHEATGTWTKPPNRNNYFFCKNDSSWAANWNAAQIVKGVKFQEPDKQNRLIGIWLSRPKSCDLSEDTHCVVGVEDVGGGGVVHNDDLVQVTTQATQVLDVITSVKDAGLPEQAAAESPPLVQEVRDGVCVLSGVF